MVVIEEMFGIVEQVKLVFCCLVLEKCEELIIEGGLDVVGNLSCMIDVCQCLVEVNILVFLFIDGDECQFDVVKVIGVLYIEIYIGYYVDVISEVE